MHDRKEAERATRAAVQRRVSREALEERVVLTYAAAQGTTKLGVRTMQQ